MLFAGDMLFYYDGEQTDILLNMANASDQRIIASTACALLAAWLYLLGAVQIYLAFRPASRPMQLIIFGCFSAIVVSYGVVHAAYLAIATSAKLSLQFGLPLEDVTHLAIFANDLLRILVYPFVLVFTGLFVYQVWIGRSAYPKWVILFVPTWLFLAQNPIVSSLSGVAKLVVAGGYLNLIFTIFFVASTIALWKNKNGEP